MDKKLLEKAFESAKAQYAAIGVDVEKAMENVSKVKISLHCWQGDDVGGFVSSGALTGGIQVNGNYLGKARTPEELRKDLSFALSLIPGKHKVNLHAIYVDTDEKVDLRHLKPEYFKKWVEWAKKEGLGLDFNPTCFSNPMLVNGFSLSSPDEEVRKYWIDHCKSCLTVGDYFAHELGQDCVTNIWIPDGYKDTPVDRLAPRKRYMESLDEILSFPYDKKHQLVALESKVFGIGVESYTTGSNEFVLGYCASRDISVTLDAGHFHPTEVISDKISSVLLYTKELLLHVSRPVRWDSDHVVTFDDELNNIAYSLVRNGLIERTHIGLDYFDATINRVAAWVIGTRNMIKALLKAYLEPTDFLRKVEDEGDFTTRLALTEELKTYPFGVIFDMYCVRNGVPTSDEWFELVKKYEKDVLAKR